MSSTDHQQPRSDCPIAPDLRHLHGSALLDGGSAPAPRQSSEQWNAPQTWRSICLANWPQVAPCPLQPGEDTRRAPSEDVAGWPPISRSVASAWLRARTAARSLLQFLRRYGSFSLSAQTFSAPDEPKRGDNAPEHRIFPPLNPCAQHDAETTDRQADHLTPFGARVPAPIAVPPRRSARHPHLVLAVLWLAAFLSTGTAALLALQALSDWNHAQELAARI